MDTNLPVGGAVTRSLDIASCGHPSSTFRGHLNTTSGREAPHRGKTGKDGLQLVKDRPQLMMMEAEKGRRVGKNTTVLETFIEGQVNFFALGLSHIPCPLACSRSFLFCWCRFLSVLARMTLVEVLARLMYVCYSSLGSDKFGPSC